jgi:CubicO group peptidase (beta-lactamase class C family)
LWTLRAPSDPVPPLLEAFRTAYDLPGGVIADGMPGAAPRVVALGVADPVADPDTGTAMDKGARLHIASLTKPLTAAAVLALVEAGAVDLDAPLAKQLDLGPAHDPRAAAITPRHLLAHRGGFDRSASFDPVFAPDRVGLPMDATCPQIARATWAQLPLDHAPGTVQMYSNIGFCLLSELVAAKGGDLSVPGVRLDGPAGPHWLRTSGGWQALDTSGGLHAEPAILAGAGGANATAAEFWRFAAGSHPAGDTSHPEGAAGDYYALGWRVWPTQSGAHLTHFGHLPGIFSVVFVMADGFTLVALFNGGVRDGGSAFGELFAAFCALRVQVCRP